MKKTYALVFGLISWLAVIIQYFLMLENREAGIMETTIRFLSFFTILTNTLVAVYFTKHALRGSQRSQSIWNKPGTLSSITVYILVVGLVYQVVLRPIWDPQGMARVVDELLHSINPLLVLFFWFKFEEKEKVTWNKVPKWLLYPFLYFIWAMSHGLVTGFYPYPFVNLPEIGWTRLMINFISLLAVFSVLSLSLIWTGKKIHPKRYPNHTPL
ncbi:Pr6Pr family membrane protein [Arthrospiribacter ruber]|uniref:Pr6Pr family membrane protein n=1 Tax=Arthrospiribacter ruber TaxID=2487934 RepID=A0A951J5T3_9BACT|nr:Pr6Pr family membrane protein [Arthrospiribacter ruber]MBW3470058.1 hypothetical protein [Arthrospiribacter ruber]